MPCYPYCGSRLRRCDRALWVSHAFYQNGTAKRVDGGQIQLAIHPVHFGFRHGASTLTVVSIES
jgi:hypothetical protein